MKLSFYFFKSFFKSLYLSCVENPIEILVDFNLNQPIKESLLFY